MAIDNQFRINELISSGSRSIISKDSSAGNHTFIQGSKEVVTAPYEHLKGERDGEITGRIEKPKYNESELIKAVDTAVDELISPPPTPGPDVVPRKKYDDLEKLYREALSRINVLETENANLKSQVESLLSQLESLRIQLDAAKLQQSVAENRAQQTQEQYTSILGDFTQAVIKSTKEGIERVSLEAQVRGLQAQKESLKNLLTITQTQLVEQQERQASAQSATGVPGTFDQQNTIGYQIQQGTAVAGHQLYIKTENADDIKVNPQTAINVFNYDTENPQTFTFKVTGDATNWLKVGGPITLPPRDGDNPGKGFVGLQWRPRTAKQSNRNTVWRGSVEITASPSGEKFSITAEYDKEVQRDDKWKTQGNTSSGVGTTK